MMRSRATFDPNLPTINWGSWVDYPSVLHAPELNVPSVVRAASNKYQALRTLKAHGVRVPDSWLPEGLRIHNDRLADFRGNEAYPWAITIRSQSTLVVPRLFNHSGGQDIVDCCAGRATPDFYTRYLDAVKEYRIHVACWMATEDDPDAAVICAQRKVPHDGQSFANWPRTHRNGYLYHTFVPQDREHLLYSQAIQAVRALGLDFGAVDVLYSDEHYYVLEVNAASGVETPSVLDIYAQALSHWSPIRTL